MTSILDLPLGLHLDFPEAAYHEPVVGMVSVSSLIELADSPSKYLAMIQGKRRRESPALRLGSALHMALLEPARFAATYVIEPDFGPCRKNDALGVSSEQAKENKIRRDAWRQEHTGATVLEGKDGEATLGMIARIVERRSSDPPAAALFEGGVSEVTLRWRDRMTGLECRARPDSYQASLANATDYKSARDASPDGFARAASEYKYHWIEAHYRAGFRAVAKDIEHYSFVVQEKEYPYDFGIYFPKARGRDQRHRVGGAIHREAGRLPRKERVAWIFQPHRNRWIETMGDRMTQAIVLQPYEGLKMACSPAESKARFQELQAFVQEVMVEGTDYGKSFADQPQPSLWQQGAQKLAELYGFSHRFEWVEVVKDWDRMFFYFEIKCILKSRRSGEDIGEGIGSCNSKESKYAYRWAFANDVPRHLDKSKMVQKTRQSKKPPHKEYTVYRVDNEDMASQVNTLQKMAAKRAYVHAVISVTRSSGLFTQDAEDLPEEAFGVVDEERSWEQPAATVSLEDTLRAKTSGAPVPTAPPAAPEPNASRPADGQREPGNSPTPKVEVKMPPPAAKAPPKSKPVEPEPPFGGPEQEVSQKNPPTQTATRAPEGTASGSLLSPDWATQLDRMKEWITEAYKQTEEAPKKTVSGLVKRFLEGPPFPPAEVADELRRFWKMTSGAKS